VYGPEKVQFTKVLNNPSQGIELQDMLKQSLLQKALAEGEDEWKQVGFLGTFSDFHSNFEHSNIGYGFYAFKNESSKNIRVNLTLTKELNIKIGKKSPEIASNLP
jgi:hypothetical protein